MNLITKFDSMSFSTSTSKPNIGMWSDLIRPWTDGPLINLKSDDSRLYKLQHISLLKIDEYNEYAHIFTKQLRYKPKPLDLDFISILKPPTLNNRSYPSIEAYEAYNDSELIDDEEHL